MVDAGRGGWYASSSPAPRALGAGKRRRGVRREQKAMTACRDPAPFLPLRPRSCPGFPGYLAFVAVGTEGPYGHRALGKQRRRALNMRNALRKRPNLKGRQQRCVFW